MCDVIYSFQFFVVLFYFIFVLFCSLEEAGGAVGGGGVTCSHITRPLEGELLLRQTSAAPRMPSGVSHRGPGLLAAETMSYSPSSLHGFWDKPEFLELANLGECSSVKATGFSGEESAVHSRALSSPYLILSSWIHWAWALGY